MHACPQRSRTRSTMPLPPPYGNTVGGDTLSLMMPHTDNIIELFNFIHYFFTNRQNNKSNRIKKIINPIKKKHDHIDIYPSVNIRNKYIKKRIKQKKRKDRSMNF